jgi:hypothetical protein
VRARGSNVEGYNHHSRRVVARWMKMMQQHVYAMHGIRDDGICGGQDGKLPSVDDMR